MSKEKIQVSTKCTSLIKEFIVNEHRLEKFSGTKMNQSLFIESCYLPRLIIMFIDEKIKLHNEFGDPKLLLDYIDQPNNILLSSQTPARFRLPGSYFNRYINMLNESLEYLHIHHSATLDEVQYETLKSNINAYLSDSTLTENINPDLIDHIANPTLASVTNELNAKTEKLKEAEAENQQLKEMVHQLQEKYEQLMTYINQPQDTLENLQEAKSETATVPLVQMQESITVPIQDEIASLKCALLEQQNTILDELQKNIQTQETEKNELKLVIEQLQEEHAHILNNLPTDNTDLLKEAIVESYKLTSLCTTQEVTKAKEYISKLIGIAIQENHSLHLEQSKQLCNIIDAIISLRETTTVPLNKVAEITTVPTREHLMSYLDLHAKYLNQNSELIKSKKQADRFKVGDDAYKNLLAHYGINKYISPEELTKLLDNPIDRKIDAAIYSEDQIEKFEE